MSTENYRANNNPRRHNLQNQKGILVKKSPYLPMTEEELRFREWISKPVPAKKALVDAYVDYLRSNLAR